MALPIAVTMTTEVLLAGRNRPMSFLVNNLRTYALDKPVVDHTGMTGNYDFWLAFDPPRRLPGVDTPSESPDIFTAIQDQLGLRLEEKKLPFDVLAVDQAQRVPKED